MPEVTNGVTCLDTDEKRFVARLTEKYLLTVKSEGLLGLFKTMCDPDHAYDVWTNYCLGRNEGDGWVAKGRAMELVPSVALAVLSNLHFGIHSDEYMISLASLGLEDKYWKNTILWVDGDGENRDLQDMIPAPECFTRVL